MLDLTADGTYQSTMNLQRAQTRPDSPYIPVHQSYPIVKHTATAGLLCA
jgi:hypothetical protein